VAAGRAGRPLPAVPGGCREVIMRIALACALAVALVHAAPLGAQDKKAPAKPATKTLSLSGCVVRGETTPDQYTLEDKKDGGKYRLTGVNVREYVGQRVQIAGGVVETKRLTIKGGLTPNANVAAQAGAMDPARAAMAAAGGVAGPGTVELPEFKVKSVRPLVGGCPD
jgi:hypothetical protein